MGQRPKVPGVLIKSTVNVVEAPVKREEHLTSGCYTLADTSCGGCRAPLGWRYLTAHEKVDVWLTAHMHIYDGLCAGFMSFSPRKLISTLLFR